VGAIDTASRRTAAEAGIEYCKRLRFMEVLCRTSGRLRVERNPVPASDQTAEG
jgi:hypothetical protein